MDKKGMGIETLVALGLGVFLLFLVSSNLWAQTKTTVETLNACNERGGECQTVCGDLPDERMLPAGNGACGDGTTCCTSPSIKEKMSKMQSGSDSEGIMLTVSGKIRDYEAGDKIPIFLGRDYKLSVKTEDYNEKECRIRVINAQTETPLSDSSGTQIGGQDKCGDISTTIHLPVDRARQSLVLSLLVTEGDSGVVAEATFPLELQEPVRISGLSRGWVRTADVRLTCRIGDCNNAEMYVLTDRNRQSCSAGGIQNINPVLSDDFSNNDAVLSIGDEKAQEITSEGLLDAPVCFKVEMNDGSSTWMLSKRKLRIDREPPEVDFDATAAEVSCNDNNGSGCAEYHYRVIADIRSADLDNLEQTALQTLIQQAEERSVDVCRTGNYDTLSSGNNVPMGDTVAGSVCVYAEDIAGNGGKSDAIIFAYFNEEEFKNRLGEEALDFLSSNLGIFN